MVEVYCTKKKILQIVTAKKRISVPNSVAKLDFALICGESSRIDKEVVSIEHRVSNEQTSFSLKISLMSFALDKST